MNPYSATPETQTVNTTAQPQAQPQQPATISAKKQPVLIDFLMKLLFGKKAYGGKGQIVPQSGQPVQSQVVSQSLSSIPQPQPTQQQPIVPQKHTIPNSIVTSAVAGVVPQAGPLIVQPVGVQQGPKINPENLLGVVDVIAPSYIEVDFNHVRIGDKFYRVLFVNPQKFPRSISINWLSPIINFEHSLTISSFYYPMDVKDVLEKLKKKMGEMEATLMTQVETGKVIDPTTKVALKDAQSLQDAIAAGAEKLFQFALYVTVEASSLNELDRITKDVASTMAAMGLVSETATLLMEQGFKSSIPQGSDSLFLSIPPRNLDTTSIAWTFPFVTSELTMDHGILYGINMHNKSLVVFDRFGMENANSVVFATSGAGKSYFVKLEVYRNLMLGTDVIVIDPEKEYEHLCKALDGLYITFSQDKGMKINPFELPGVQLDDNMDQLREKILSLQRFFNIMFEGMNSMEKAILDRAILLTYHEKGITTDPSTQKNKPPLLEDLYKTLKGFIELEAANLSKRLERFIIGSAAGIFNEPTNVELNNPFVVFSVRDLQEELRPLAMYLMLDYIWTHVRKNKKRRILVVEEAWYMMQRPDSAEFMYSIAKRARKYYLGLTTISQDVSDFLVTEYGKAVVNNSAMKILMKQSQSAIDQIQFIFKLTNGERGYLLRCNVGEGLFFAGNQHVAIRAVSSLGEHRLMTTDPKDFEKFAQYKILEETDINKLSAVYNETIYERLYGEQ